VVPLPDREVLKRLGQHEAHLGVVVVRQVERDAARPRTGGSDRAGDQPRDHGAHRVLEAGQPVQDLPVVRAEFDPGRLAGLPKDEPVLRLAQDRPAVLGPYDLVCCGDGLALYLEGAVE
jgi:hypothetical protein